MQRIRIPHKDAAGIEVHLVGNVSLRHPGEVVEVLVAKLFVFGEPLSGEFVDPFRTGRPVNVVRKKYVQAEAEPR